MRGLEQHLDEFRAHGVRVVAISVDSPEATRKLCEKRGYRYTFLSDPKAEVIRRYGVLHAHAGPGGQDMARPAEFLIDATGTVRWANLTEDWRIRARPENILKVIEDLKLGSHFAR
ncbi:MAG: redoxin domain-containing protein [Acidobacteria bacterium]|nr:redoxin domain-containing protein [Acidobacteriota bacterium]